MENLFYFGTQEKEFIGSKLGIDISLCQCFYKIEDGKMIEDNTWHFDPYLFLTSKQRHTTGFYRTGVHKGYDIIAIAGSQHPRDSKGGTTLFFTKEENMIGKVWEEELMKIPIAVEVLGRLGIEFSFVK